MHLSDTCNDKSIVLFTLQILDLEEMCFFVSIWTFIWAELSFVLMKKKS